MSLKPKLKPQHAPKAPHEDPVFLESTPARPLRILAEYLEPLERFRSLRVRDTIVFFGSARLREDGPLDGTVVGVGLPLVEALGKVVQGLRAFPALAGPAVAVPSTICTPTRKTASRAKRRAASSMSS